MDLFKRFVRRRGSAAVVLGIVAVFAVGCGKSTPKAAPTPSDSFFSPNSSPSTLPALSPTPVTPTVSPTASAKPTSTATGKVVRVTIANSAQLESLNKGDTLVVTLDVTTGSTWTFTDNPNPAVLKLTKEATVTVSPSPSASPAKAAVQRHQWTFSALGPGKATFKLVNKRSGTTTGTATAAPGQSFSMTVVVK